VMVLTARPEGIRRPTEIPASCSTALASCRTA
jgi:hypothetical protein